MGKRASKWLLALCAFTVGMGVMAIEITASRLLAPYFGASLFVWTSLIVTVLLAMSVGYWLGGIAAERDLGLKALGYVLCGASLVLIGGVVIIGDLSQALTGLFIAWTNASATLFLGSLAVSVVVFAVPVFLLAAAGPVILKEWTKSGGDIGRTAGKYFAISTFGSVIGTVLPTLLLVPSIGAKGTIQLFAVLFILLGASLLTRGDNKFFALFAIPLFGASFLSTEAVIPGTIMSRESPYQLIRVKERDGGRYLIFNEGSGIQSIYYPHGGRGELYYFDMMGVLPLLRSYDASSHKAAIIGLAGGSIAREYFNYVPKGPDGTIVGVEVDPDVIEVAREHFDLDDLGLRVVNQDGRMFLATSDELYDVIVVDAYSTQLYIPAHMATAEFYALTKSRLKPGGIMVMNVNAPDRESRLLKALINSAAPSFANVQVIPVPGAWNHLVLASDEPMDLGSAASRVPAEDFLVQGALLSAYPATFDPEAEIFTDDRAPIEALTDSMIMGEVFHLQD